jgi:hypothetical protein
MLKVLIGLGPDKRRCGVRARRGRLTRQTAALRSRSAQRGPPGRDQLDRLARNEPSIVTVNRLPSARSMRRIT